MNLRQIARRGARRAADNEGLANFETLCKSYLCTRVTTQEKLQVLASTAKGEYFSERGPCAYFKQSLRANTRQGGRILSTGALAFQYSTYNINDK
jgi:hypothetical protein